MNYLTETFTLNNGVKIPMIGYGTWQITEGPDAVEIFKTAIKKGYRHIDTAAIYDNERSVGKAVEECDVDREDLFITSKVKSNIKTYDETIEAFNESLNKLGTDYLDLYLIHGPTPMHDREGNYDQANLEVWRALETLYKAGKIRSIGVSNFRVSDLENILTKAEIIPQVNQIRFFVGEKQEDIVKFCNEHKILVEAYSPLGQGKLLDNPVLKDLAKKYQVSEAQIAIKYCLQKDTLPLPKTKTPSRMVDNATLNFTISDADMNVLDAIDDNLR